MGLQELKNKFKESKPKELTAEEKKQIEDFKQAQAEANEKVIALRDDGVFRLALLNKLEQNNQILTIGFSEIIDRLTKDKPVESKPKTDGSEEDEELDAEEDPDLKEDEEDLQNEEDLSEEDKQIMNEDKAILERLKQTNGKVRI